MVKNNYLEPNKVTLEAWVDKALQQSLKKENVKLRFKVFGIWPLNPATMVEKFSPGDVFIVIKEGKHEVSYHSNAIDEYSNNEVEATKKLLNITKTFQVELSTTFDCPPSPMPCYYVEMSNNFNITTNNREED